MYLKIDKGYSYGIYTGLWDGRGPGLLAAVNVGWRPPIASKYKALRVEFGREYRLRMAEEEDFIKCYVDGELVLELPMDDRFTFGPVDLYITNMRAYFDDFVITGDNIPDGGPGLNGDLGSGKGVESVGKLATTWGDAKAEY